MNCAIDSAISNHVTLVPILSHDQRSHVAPYLNCLLPKKCNDDIDDAVGIM